MSNGAAPRHDGAPPAVDRDVLFGVLALGEARDLRPMPPKERRDAVLGWGGLIGGVAAVACLLAPMP